MKKHLAFVLILSCFYATTPAFAQDSSRLNDLEEKVGKSVKKEARAQKRVERQRKKLERKEKKLERKQNKTDRRARKREREQRKLEREQEKRDTTFTLSPLVYYRRDQV